MNRFIIVGPLALLVCTVAAIGQALVKRSMNAVPLGVTGIDAAIVLLRTPLFYAGGVVALAGQVLWLYLMSRGDLSYVTPFLGMGVVTTLIVSVLVLNESITPTRVAGTLVIAVGIALVARS